MHAPALLHVQALTVTLAGSTPLNELLAITRSFEQCAATQRIRHPTEKHHHPCQPTRSSLKHPIAHRR
jgi:hypothetical protein